jgi:xylulokinase
MKDYVLGIDLGTSGVKSGLVDLATLELNYVSERSYPDDAEQDLETLWEKTVDATRESVIKLDGRGTVRAIGLTGQMHGAVLYDGVGNPIGPLINWQDQKWSSQDTLQKMTQAMAGRTYAELGTEISSGYSGAILFGIMEKDPDLFHRTMHFVLPTDFLRGKLLGTNDYATDRTNACATGLFNTKINSWHEDLIQELQLPLRIFPHVHLAHQQAGTISDQVGDSIGLQRKIPVIYGGGDNQMSMVGSGLTVPGSPILINIGTAAQISKVIAEFVRYPGMDTRAFFNGAYTVVGASLGGGTSYQWLRGQINQEKGKNINYSQMDELAAQVPPGSDGLFFCTGPTRQQTGRRKGFYGNTTRLDSISHRAKAVMEGVLMDLLDGYEIMKINDQSDYLMAGGKGLQKSRVWSQVAADLFGKPVRITRSENAVLGAGVMAAYGVGLMNNLEESTDAVENVAEMTPDLAKADFYRDEFVTIWRAKVGSL